MQSIDLENNVHSLGSIPKASTGLKLWASVVGGFLLVQSLLVYGVSFAAAQRAQMLGVDSQGTVHVNGQPVTTMGTGLRFKAKYFPIEVGRQGKGLYRHGCMSRTQLDSLWNLVVGRSMKTTISMFEGEYSDPPHGMEWALELAADGAHRNATHDCFSTFQATMMFCHDKLDTHTCVEDGGHGKFITYPQYEQGALAGHGPGVTTPSSSPAVTN